MQRWQLDYDFGQEIARTVINTCTPYVGLCIRGVLLSIDQEHGEHGGEAHGAHGQHADGDTNNNTMGMKMQMACDIGVRS